MTFDFHAITSDLECSLCICHCNINVTSSIPEIKSFGQVYSFVMDTLRVHISKLRALQQSFFNLHSLFAQLLLFLYHMLFRSIINIL